MSAFPTAAVHLALAPRSQKSALLGLNKAPGHQASSALGIAECIAAQEFSKCVFASRHNNKYS